jgi:endonuclease/exonuclease/phosphatase family metal-dependent hydrolase
LLGGLVGLGGCNQADRPTPIVIDGALADWMGQLPVATDPAGDATGAFDITRVWACNRGSNLFLRFTVGRPLNLQAGPESDGTLRIRIGTPAGRRLIIDTRNRMAYTDLSPDQRIPWSAIRYVAGPTYAQSEFEVRVDLAYFGGQIGRPVTIQFDGSDRLDEPVLFHLTDPSLPTPRRSLDRRDSSDVRIVSLNTWHNGLSDPNRADAFARLLGAVEGDVLCLQEEWETPELHGAITRIVPPGRGRRWHVHRAGGCAVASRSPLTPLPSDEKFFAAALVHLPAGPALVFSVHLDSRGHAGSPEDRKRIEQAEFIAEVINRFRAGQLGPYLAEHRQVPVFLAGDFNLVGSRTPLDRILAADAGVMREVKLPHAAGRDVYTWRAGRETDTFPPGRLDFVVYGARGVRTGNGYVLDTHELSAAQRLAYDLNRGDSQASDHLLLVADFAYRALP